MDSNQNNSNGNPRTKRDQEMESKLITMGNKQNQKFEDQNGIEFANALENTVSENYNPKNQRELTLGSNFGQSQISDAELMSRLSARNINTNAPRRQRQDLGFNKTQPVHTTDFSNYLAQSEFGQDNKMRATEAQAMRRGTLQTPLFRKQNFENIQGFRPVSMNLNNATNFRNVGNNQHENVQKPSHMSPSQLKVVKQMMFMNNANVLTSREVNSLTKNLVTSGPNSPGLIQAVLSPRRGNNPSIQSNKSPLFSSFAQKQGTTETNSSRAYPQREPFSHRGSVSVQMQGGANVMGDHMSQYSMPVLLSPDGRIKWNKDKHFSRKHIKIMSQLSVDRVFIDKEIDLGFGCSKPPNEVILPGGPEEESPVDHSGQNIEPFSKACLRKSSSKSSFLDRFHLLYWKSFN